jgi:hypothetical protein
MHTHPQPLRTFGTEAKTLQVEADTSTAFTVLVGLLVTFL